MRDGKGRQDGTPARGLVAALLLTGILLAGCVEQSQVYRARPTTTRIQVDGETDGGSQRFILVGRPLPVPPQRRHLPSPDLPLRFEPPSAMGNRDYVQFDRPYAVWRGIREYQTDGIASWYGPGFHGLYTANGEVYDQYGISAAHKNLPLPSYLRVTNLENGHQLVVRVNDRGPFLDDRILDLSYGAAERLGMLEQGVARVHIELLSPPATDSRRADQTEQTIQLLTTESDAQAREMADTLSHQLGLPVQVVAGRRFYRLQVGPLETDKARQLLDTLKGAGYDQAYLTN